MRFYPAILLTLCACLPTQHVRRDPASAAVLSAESHTVAVFIDAKCDNLSEATASGNGFFVAPRIVVTVDHILEHRQRTFPDFAVVRPDGTCQYAQYADRNEGADLLFLLVHGRDDHPLELSIPVPKIGDTLYTVSVADKRARLSDVNKGKSVTFNRISCRRIPFDNPELNEMEYPPVFSASPHLREGDSGSPIFDPQGRVVGMAQARAFNKKTRRHTADSYLSSYVIRHFLGKCVICQED